MDGKMAEKWKNGQKTFFWAILGWFSRFPAFFFPHFPGEAKIHLPAIVPGFGTKARKQSVAGQQDGNGENNALVKYRALPPK